MQHVIKVSENVSYVDYYRAIASTDVLLPTFSEEKYLINIASSSIPTALVAKVHDVAVRTPKMY